ncbi:MAG: hypothetical protein R3313_00455 [Candidatus Saccharimonadales bacterium]|nr:hypothetical protein [Candidatus Saccharimonadales bacterium]
MAGRRRGLNRCKKRCEDSNKDHLNGDCSCDSPRFKRKNGRKVVVDESGSSE